MPALIEKEATAVISVVRAYLYLPDSDEELQILSLSTTFLLNTIPQAQVVVAVGQEATAAQGGGVVSAQELSEKMKQFTRAEIWMFADGWFSPDLRWPEDEFRVFSGYVAGVSLHRSAGSFGLVVNLIHWLVDLDASSCLSDDVVAGSPILLPLPGVQESLAANYIDMAAPALLSIPRDVWRQGIKEAFKDLSKRTPFYFSALTCGESTVFSGETGNERALARIVDGQEGVFDVQALANVPTLEIDTPIANVLGYRLAASATARLYRGSVGSSTFWEKLIELSGLFQFSVVPLVDTALCVPLMPCLAGDDPPRHVTIKSNELISYSPSEAMFRMWRGVAVLAQYANSYGAADDAKSNEVQIWPAAGCYLADNDEDLSDEARSAASKGAMQTIPAPDWIQDGSVEDATNVWQTIYSMNTSMDDTERIRRADEAAAQRSAVSRDDLKALGDRFAEWWYWINQFKGRTGEIVSKLRFDVCPGSVVRIEDLDGKLSGAVRSSYAYAMVTSVRVVVNTASQQAATAMTLSHIRREGERKYGTDRHPLYKNRWVGTVLQNLKMSGNGFFATNARSESP